MRPQPGQPLLGVKRVGGVAVVRFLRPAIRDVGLVEAVAGELSRVLAREVPPRLVLDFGGVTYLSSAMLGAVLTANHKARAAGGRLALCALAPEVAALFGVTRLDREFDIYPTEQEALRSFED